MPEVNRTNTYDESVSWGFHESYYSVNFNVMVEVLDNPSNGMCTGTRTAVDGYIFRIDEFKDNTVDYVVNFANNFGYDFYIYDEFIYVLKGNYRDRPAGVSVKNNPDFQKGDVFIYDCEGSFKTASTKYIDKNGYPGKNYYWSDSNEDVGDDDDTENEEDIGTGDGDATGDTGEEGGSDIESPSGDSPGSDYDIVDIDNLDDATEILQEMYKAQTSYYTDSLEVQRNAFDVSIVALSLDFCIVFLCGILVGCAFARSLWHKMNVG